tara:strand:- start:32 stop:526 length:495 start_codon:yes stop_codon:yes gene_type:complete
MKRILKAHIRASICIIACITIAFAFTFGFKYQLVYTDGVSMSPTIDDGQWMVIEKRGSGNSWAPRKYDVVVACAKDVNDLVTKRIIGLPGDAIEIIEGVIYVNDEKLNDFYGRGKITYKVINETYECHAKEIIPEGCVWVIGDNRETSYFGIIPIKDVLGIVIW